MSASSRCAGSIVVWPSRSAWALAPSSAALPSALIGTGSSDGVPMPCSATTAARSASSLDAEQSAIHAHDAEQQVHRAELVVPEPP